MHKVISFSPTRYEVIFNCQSFSAFFYNKLFRWESFVSKFKLSELPIGFLISLMTAFSFVILRLYAFGCASFILSRKQYFHNLALSLLQLCFDHSEGNIFWDVGDFSSSRYTCEECSTDIFSRAQGWKQPFWSSIWAFKFFHQ